MGAAGAPGDAIDFTGGSSSLALGISPTTIGTLEGGLGVTGTLTLTTPSSTTLTNVIHDGAGGAGAVIYDSTSTLTLSGASTFSGGITIKAGTLDLGASHAAGSGAIAFAPAFNGSSELDLDTAAQNVGGTFANTLTNFNAAGDTIDLRNFAFNGVVAYTSTGSSLTVTGGTGGLQSETFSLSNGALAYTAQSDGAGGTLISSVCYAQGTRIRTLRGDVAVEELSNGDHAVTSSGETRPILWLGRRTMNFSNHPRPYEAHPIRIAAHAFGDNRPARDLFVSPGHSICVDVLGEVLIPVSALVNGSTIQQVDVDEVTYWHVELGSHDILLAENLPAESYLDMGNRSFFAEGEVVALTASPDADPAQRTHADFCRPFVDDGPILDAVRMLLRQRAEAIGWRSTDALELHLIVDGQRLDPVVRDLTARFHLPADAKDVWLVSPTARPRDAMATGDARDLGLYIGGLRIDDGFSVRDVVIDDPLLCIGFHDVEDGARRWTSGCARLPATLWDGCVGGFYLRVDLAGRPVPRWTAPEAAEAFERRRLAIVA